MKRKEFEIYMRRIIFELKSAIVIAEHNLPENAERQTWEVKKLKPEVKEKLVERIKKAENGSINALSRVFSGIPDSVIYQEPECQDDSNFDITRETGGYLALISLKDLVREWENDLILFRDDDVEE